MISLNSLSCVWFFLLLWESLTLVGFFVGRPSHVAPVLVASGSSVLASWSLVFVWPGEEKLSQRKATVKRLPGGHGTKSLFYELAFSLVNSFFGTATLFASVVYLNTSASLLLQSSILGESAVAFPTIDGMKPTSVFVNGTPIVRFYNAKLSSRGAVSYSHGTKKYCASPIVSLACGTMNYSKFWARRQISQNGPCLGSYFSGNSSETGSYISVGRRVSISEEASLSEAIERKNVLSDGVVAVEAYKVEERLLRTPMWGLKYYALSLVWLVPTTAAFCVVTKKSRKDK